MSKQEILIGGRVCFLYQDAAATHTLIQPVDEHDLELLDQEVEAIRQLSGKPFTLVAVMIKDWNQELTPWVAPPVFGKVSFGDGASETLTYISEKLIPSLAADGIYDAAKMKLLLGGYSLAGLFALWAGYQSDQFCGIAAASPSVWYPQWIDFASVNTPMAKSVYLSLGDKEEKAKNPVMAQVGNAIRLQHELLTQQGVNTLLEWNPGNHFVDSDKRMAKAFAWVINALSAAEHSL